MEAFHRAMHLALKGGVIVLKAGIAVVAVAITFFAVIIKIALGN